MQESIDFLRRMSALFSHAACALRIWDLSGGRMTGARG